MPSGPAEVPGTEADGRFPAGADAVQRADAGRALNDVLARPDLLTVVAQPIVDLTDGRAAGFELLARVPGHYGVAPDMLFDEAGRRGVSGLLQARVNRLAVDLLPRLPQDCFLTVNLDPADLADEAVLASLLAQRTLATLVVEVTERRWPQVPGPAEDALVRLRARGALLAVDDVGTGFAGLGQISRLRPEFVKLDRALVAELGRDPGAELVVTALGRLCAQLDAWVVAEGVERQGQLAVLVRLGVPLAQGWFLGADEQPWPGVPGAAQVRLLADDGAARRVLGAGPALPVALLLLRDREVAWERDAGGVWWTWLDGPRRRATTLAPETTVAEALLRAVARSREVRWSPLLVTDASGEVRGYVTVESLVTTAVAAL